MIEFRRNEETGILEAYKDGERIAAVDTMGDHVIKEEEKENGKAQHRSDSPGRRS